MTSILTIEESINISSTSEENLNRSSTSSQISLSTTSYTSSPKESFNATSPTILDETTIPLTSIPSINNSTVFYRKSSSRLSTGAICGIVISSVAVLGIVAGIALFTGGSIAAPGIASAIIPSSNMLESEIINLNTQLPINNPLGIIQPQPNIPIQEVIRPNYPINQIDQPIINRTFQPIFNQQAEIVPTHEVVPIQQVEMVPTHEVVPIQQVEMVSTQEIIPAKVEMVANQEVVPIQQVEMVANQEVVPIQQVEMVSRQEIIPAKIEMVANQEVFPIQQVEMVTTHEVVPVQQVEMVSRQEIIPSKVEMVANQEVVPIQQVEMVPTQVIIPQPNHLHPVKPIASIHPHPVFPNCHINQNLV